MRCDIRFGGNGRNPTIRLTATEIGEGAVFKLLSQGKWGLVDSWTGQGTWEYAFGVTSVEKSPYLEFGHVPEVPDATP